MDDVLERVRALEQKAYNIFMRVEDIEENARELDKAASSLLKRMDANPTLDLDIEDKDLKHLEGVL